LWQSEIDFFIVGKMQLWVGVVKVQWTEVTEPYKSQVWVRTGQNSNEEKTDK
jgi:hypothetical protein